MDCSCSLCVKACKQKPGWFAPGEAEKVAEFLHVPLKDLFKKKLMVDWFEADQNIFILSPAVTHGSPGTEFPGDPRGRCVFLSKDDKCEIHEVKPIECRSYLHSHDTTRHKEVAEMWNNEEGQNQIKSLLGRDPYATEFEGFLGLGY